MCKPEENEILNREIKGWKQVRKRHPKNWNKWERERGKREQMRNICFWESVIEEKWEREANEGKDKNNFVSFVCRKGN